MFRLNLLVSVFSLLPVLSSTGFASHKVGDWIEEVTSRVRTNGSNEIYLIIRKLTSLDSSTGVFILNTNIKGISNNFRSNIDSQWSGQPDNKWGYQNCLDSGIGNPIKAQIAGKTVDCWEYNPPNDPNPVYMSSCDLPVGGAGFYDGINRITGDHESHKVIDFGFGN